MQLNDIEDKIYEAAKLTFTQLRQQSQEEFYAYALYTDDSAMTVVPAANSLNGLAVKLQEEAEIGEPDEPIKLYYKWASAEWQYEAWGGKNFQDICSIVRHHPKRVEFTAFREEVINAMTQALKRLDNEGFFGTGSQRKAITLFVTSSDSDDAEEIENRSAVTLNPLNADDFLRRFEN